MDKAFLNDLKYSDILKIAQCIERFTSSDGWSEIAKQIALHKNDITVHEIEYLKHGYTIKVSLW